MSASTYEALGGQRHRHGAAVVHEHPHDGPHSHGHSHAHGDARARAMATRTGSSTTRSSARATACGRSSPRSPSSAVAAALQTLVFVLSGSVALLADLIHNFGDALTAVPLGVAFLLRSERAERTAGLFVVAAIFVSACVAGVEAVSRLIHPDAPSHLWALALAGAIGYAGNLVAAPDPPARRAAAGQPRPDRRRPPRPRRRLRVAGRHRLGRGRRHRHPDRRPAHRPGDHRWSSCASRGSRGGPCAATSTRTDGADHRLRRRGRPRGRAARALRRGGRRRARRALRRRPRRLLAAHRRRPRLPRPHQPVRGRLRHRVRQQGVPHQHHRGAISRPTAPA